MTSAFISYSHHDRAVADFIAAELRNREVDVFVDYLELRAGDFVSQLGQTIERQDFFLAVISPDAIKSKWVRAEIGWAFTRKSGKFIIPIWLKPALLTDVFVLNQLERVDFTQWYVDRNMQKSVQRLAQLMNISLESVKSATVPEPMSSSSDEQDMESSNAAGIEDSSPPALARRDVTSMFQVAASVQDSDPERALFLYQQILDIDPTFLGGNIGEYVSRQEAQMKPMRLMILEERAQRANSEGNWSELLSLAKTMLEISPTDSFAEAAIDIATANASCEPTYAQAKIAADSGNYGAVNVLLRDLRQECPDYGDPARLLGNQPIDRDLVVYLRSDHTLMGHIAPITDLAFSQCGQTLATASTDRTIRVWTVSNGKLHTTLPDVVGTMKTIAFSPNGQHFAAVADDGTLTLWQTDSWQISRKVQSDQEFTTLVFSADSKLVIAGSRNWEVIAFKLPELRPVKSLESRYANVDALTLTPSGLLVCSSNSAAGHVPNSWAIDTWRADKWEKIHIGEFSEPSSLAPMTHLVASRDGLLLAAMSYSRLRVWHMPQCWDYWDSGEMVEWPSYSDLALCPGDSRLLTVVGGTQHEGWLHHFDLADGKYLKKTAAHFAAINTVATSSDGRYIATGSDDCTAKIWQL